MPQERARSSGLLPHATLTVPRDLEGRRIRIPSHGLALNRTLAETLHIGRGDLIGFEPVKGQRRLRHVPIVEISDSYLGTAVYADIGYLSRFD